jgi:hypothetical protein
VRGALGWGGRGACLATAGEGVCVCVRARACVCVYVCMCVCTCVCDLTFPRVKCVGVGRGKRVKDMHVRVNE